MKILKVIHGYPPTYNAGSEVYSRSICEELAKKHEVIVFTREQDEYRLDFDIRHDTQNEIPLILLNMPREKDGYDHPKVNSIFDHFLQQTQPDVVHIGHLNHLSTGLVQEVKKQNIPIVFTLHDFWLMCPRGQFLQRNFDGQHLYQLCKKQQNGKCATTCYNMYHSCNPNHSQEDTAHWTSWIARRMEATRQIADMIDVFIAPSHYLRNRFIQDFGLPKDKILYLDYGFPLHYLKPVPKVVNRKFTIGYIGTHIPAKGINLLIEAFKKLKGEACLKIWGRPSGQSTAALKRLTADCSNPIIFEGEYMNPNIAKQVFAQVDVIVVPSIWGENSPLVIHEAQACHVPVITADFGGMKEYVQHEINGLLFEHRNVESLAKTLQRACEHPKALAKMGKRGYLYHKIGQVLSIEEHCQQLELIYQKTIQQHEPTRPLANHH